MGFQSFEAATRPEDGPPRLAQLRERMAAAGIDGFLVPRADAHQGEYVAARDERLAWLTGFTGSAGFCAVLQDVAGLFVDGRYTLQAAAQVDSQAFTPIQWPNTKLPDWLAEQCKGGAKIGFDPWLHTPDQIDDLRKKGEVRGITYCEISSIVDGIWMDQPDPPLGAVAVHPVSIAGQSSEDKRKALGTALDQAGEVAAVITLPDSIAWLLNIRGQDIARNPVPHGFAVLHATGQVDLFMDSRKLGQDVRDHMGPDVRIHAPGDLEAALRGVNGRVRIDPATAPYALRAMLAEPAKGKDPCILPKAKKNAIELKGMAAAHDRDSVAVIRLLHWLDGAVGSGTLTEIDVAQKLEALRAEAPELREISFDTISGSGPNGAIVHYRVTAETNRVITPGELLLIDSGGQYSDGTTDITRTLSTGAVTDDQKACFTRVLKGMIAVSQVRWPEGLAGRDLDALARAALWQAGLDYDHGTGHGVGAYLSVHEGPQGISRRSSTPLEPGMVVSNEPGYYRTGEFGIRIENLVFVVKAEPIGDLYRTFFAFETLTWAPIDRRLIDTALLTQGEVDWLDRYHRSVLERIGPELPDDVATWLAEACAPLT